MVHGTNKWIPINRNGLVLSGMHEGCVGVEIHHLWNVGVPYSQENNQSSNFCHTNASQTQELRHFNISFFTV